MSLELRYLKRLVHVLVMLFGDASDAGANAMQRLDRSGSAPREQAGARSAVSQRHPLTAPRWSRRELVMLEGRRSTPAPDRGIGPIVLGDGASGTWAKPISIAR